MGQNWVHIIDLAWAQYFRVQIGNRPSESSIRFQFPPAAEDNRSVAPRRRLFPNVLPLIPELWNLCSKLTQMLLKTTKMNLSPSAWLSPLRLQRGPNPNVPNSRRSSSHRLPRTSIQSLRRGLWFLDATFPSESEHSWVQLLFLRLRTRSWIHRFYLQLVHALLLSAFSLINWHSCWSATIVIVFICFIIE